ncbi:hypothetical protein [Carboxydothermus hydrogenoformans]|uniref:Uncharacterized protein n=1 Tax=Carboxydothermus hydrogenoformans (strain ATCC BAA-161 / DSM 6008 / Z-2901) TaxID=246194 RepID=Q3AA44_CARHZ|nr:hypothetical protein [Carboxydothermus hydrogenoformans]ABB14096.1 conserved hypothetical protein [Carboxydothermus hydrogenoformans Z-2901]
MLKFSKEDYEFFFPLLDKENQEILKKVAVVNEDEVIIDDEEIEVDLYEWLNDLVVTKGFDKRYNLNSIGQRLEKLSDYVFSIIEE